MIAFVLDVESIGLHGQHYAVGWVVIDLKTGRELACGVLACDPEKAFGCESDREWVKANVPPIEVNCLDPKHVCNSFWPFWREWEAKGAVMFADCQWPVEARFLIACVKRDSVNRKWEGPYPLHEIASFMQARGLDPKADYPRNGNELPKHHPLADARQSARLLANCYA